MTNEIRRSGVSPEDIAVLTLGGQVKSELFGTEQLGSHRVVPADAPDASEHVVLDTFLRFKGLERPVVLVTELGAGKPFGNETRMYIALTRATAACRIVASVAEVAEDERLERLRTG